MANEISYLSVIQSCGKSYSRGVVINGSHYYDTINESDGRAAGNSHIWGDASEQTQIKAIDALIAAGERSGLQPREIAHILAIARVESGFNPDAAAGTSSAYGLGQFINKTGASYGINDSNRGNLRTQADALVAHYQDNAALAHKRGQGEEYIYKYHHDGPIKEYGGLGISKKEVMPYVDKYEKFVREHQQKLGKEPLGPSTVHRSNSGTRHTHHDSALHPGAHGATVAAMQKQLKTLGYTDAHGHPLTADGNFGPGTCHALEAFQRAHELKDNGIAGPDTLTKLHAAVKQHEHAPAPSLAGTMADPGHPGHSVFTDIRARLDDFNTRNHANMDPRHLDQLTAALAVQVHDNTRFRHINDITLSRDGQEMFLIQSHPISEEVRINVVQGMNTPMEHSTQGWDQISQQQQLKTQEQPAQEQGNGQSR